MDRDVLFYLLVFAAVTIPHLIIENRALAYIVSIAGIIIIGYNEFKNFKDGEEA